MSCHIEFKLLVSVSAAVYHARSVGNLAVQVLYSVVTMLQFAF